MKNLLSLGHLVIEVSLHATHVDMCRHGVPNATRLQLGDTHLQLAGTHPGYTIDNHLVDNAVVRLLHLTSLDVVGLLQSHLLGGERSMCASRVEIELGRLCGILTGHDDILGTTAHVESLLESQRVGLSIDSHRAFATHVDDAQFTVVEQVASVVTLALIHIERRDRREFQRCRGRLSATNEESIEHCVGPVHLSWSKHFLYEIFLAQAVGGVMLSIFRSRCPTHIVMGVSVFSLHLIAFRAAALSETSQGKAAKGCGKNGFLHDDITN